MKLKFFFLLSLFVIVACGAKKSGSDAADSSQRNPTTDSCKVEIKKTDSPAIIARKAYKMQLDCKLKSEDDLTKKLLKV